MVVNLKKTKKEKKRLFILSCLILFLVGSLVTSVSKDWTSILNNNQEIKKLTTEYEELLTEEEQLKSEVTKLQDPDYVARYAKEKYMYSGEGETIIRMD